MRRDDLLTNLTESYFQGNLLHILQNYIRSVVDCCCDMFVFNYRD